MDINLKQEVCYNVSETLIYDETEGLADKYSIVPRKGIKNLIAVIETNHGKFLICKPETHLAKSISFLDNTNMITDIALFYETSTIKMESCDILDFCVRYYKDKLQLFYNE